MSNFFRTRLDDVAGVALGGAIVSAVIQRWEVCLMLLALSATGFVLKFVLDWRSA